MSEKITSYKGFNSALQCRDFQFEVGKTYEHEGEVEACRSGFHACQYPLDVFSYYPPAGSRFAVVEQCGDLSKDGEDSKTASRSIKLNFEIGIPGLVKAAIEYTFSRALPINPDSAASATGDQGAASATGTRGAASATGDQGAASATGYQGAASATGYRGAASATGDQGAASATGYQGAASATGYQGAASATGDQGAASATGYQGAASATGTRGVALSGWDGKAKAGTGGAIVLVWRDDDRNVAFIRSSKVGENGIEPDVWYTLDESGEFVEAE